MIPKQQLQNDDINTNSDITESLFSAGKPSNTVTSKVPLIVGLDENPDTGDTLDFTAQGNTLSDLILPLEITPSSSNKVGINRPLIEVIDDPIAGNDTNILADSSGSNERGSTNFFITESNVSKAASFYSTTSQEPESTPTEFGGQWAERTRPLIEEVENASKSDTIKVEAIEDLEDLETPSLHSGNSNTPQHLVGENDRKESLPDTSEGETDKIAELAEKAGSTLDPVTVDHALLQTLRQKYQ